MDSKKRALGAVARVDSELADRAATGEIANLSVEQLLQLRSSLVHFLAPPKKDECACSVVSVDDDPNKTTGRQCRCFKLTNPNRKIASFHGPGFTNWVSGSGGGASATGNPTENVVDPVGGEAFVVEYKCRCKDEAV